LGADGADLALRVVIGMLLSCSHCVMWWWGRGLMLMWRLFTQFVPACVVPGVWSLDEVLCRVNNKRPHGVVVYYMGDV